MIKKIIFVFLLSCLITSCGRKADPEYNNNDPDQKAEIKIILTNKT